MSREREFNEFIVSLMQLRERAFALRLPQAAAHISTAIDVAGWQEAANCTESARALTGER